MTISALKHWGVRSGNQDMNKYSVAFYIIAGAVIAIAGYKFGEWLYHAIF